MQRLAATRSRTDKEQILIDAFMNGCFEFFTGARLATDKLISFGVKRVAEISEDDGAPGAFSFDDFLALTTRLRNRELTGHAARDAINAAAEVCHVPTWNRFYRRILLRDLNVGCDEKTINKVLNKLVPAYPEAEQYMIPVFKLQLAHNGEDPVHQKKIRGRKLIDTKLDGMRVVAAMDTEIGAVDLFTRTGLIIETFPEVKAGLQQVLKRLPGSIALDGELMSPHGFDHLMTLVRRNEPHPDTALIRYALFDILPLEDFRKQHCPRPQRERREVLEAMQREGIFNIIEPGPRRFYVVPQIEVDLDTDEGRKALSEYNRQVIDDGCEGIMIKDPEAPYVGKRSAAWLKSKPTLEVTLEIVGVEPGDADGKYAHTLGALVCRGNDLGVEIKSDVSGVSDELRDQLWRERDSLPGLLVEVIADKLTLQQGSTIYSLRFPRLKGFRGRVPGEKL